jgi:hypothetical protein
MKRKSRKLLVEVIRRLTQLVGPERLADVDDFSESRARRWRR